MLTYIHNWFKIEPIEQKPETISDYLTARYERILRLRELARKEAAENVKNGQPYNLFKLNQADHLLRAITDRLNNRPIYHNRFNMN